MRYQEFVDSILKGVRDYYGNDAEVSVNSVLKNNNGYRDALHIRFSGEDSNICPSIYLDTLYEEYSECEYDKSIFDIVKNENNMEASIQDDTGLITYEVQKTPNVEETNKEIDVMKESVHNTEQDCEYTVKKRTLKKDNYIDGQYSLF